MNIKMHTGCSCPQCRKGMTRHDRRQYHRKMRQRQKRQIKRFNEIIDAYMSIGYTD